MLPRRIISFLYWYSPFVHAFFSWSHWTASWDHIAISATLCNSIALETIIWVYHVLWDRLPMSLFPLSLCADTCAWDQAPSVLLNDSLPSGKVSPLICTRLSDCPCELSHSLGRREQWAVGILVTLLFEKQWGRSMLRTSSRTTLVLAHVWLDGAQCYSQWVRKTQTLWLVHIKVL